MKTKKTQKGNSSFFFNIILNWLLHMVREFTFGRKYFEMFFHVMLSCLLIRVLLAEFFSRFSTKFEKYLIYFEYLRYLSSYISHKLNNLGWISHKVNHWSKILLTNFVYSLEMRVYKLQGERIHFEFRLTRFSIDPILYLPICCTALVPMNL